MDGLCWTCQIPWEFSVHGYPDCAFPLFSLAPQGKYFTLSITVIGGVVKSFYQPALPCRSFSLYSILEWPHCHSPGAEPRAIEQSEFQTAVRVVQWLAKVSSTDSGRYAVLVGDQKHDVVLVEASLFHWLSVVYLEQGGIERKKADRVAEYINEKNGNWR